MESVPVNWEALDALVLDFAKSEHLLVLEDSPSPPPSSPSSPSNSSSSSSPSSSSYQSRLLIRQIRWCLESGDVDAAIDLLRLHVPALLDDHRILFRLQKQKFIELLRKRTDRDRDSAIQCLRADLAPCALDAYPEAYDEFKHALLALIFDKEDQTSPVANEWSERRRSDLAGQLCSILRAQLHAYDPVFSLSLRYLISIHKVYSIRQGISSPISDLIERLLLDDRDPPATPEQSLYEAPPFDEVDIQALAHAVELTRQGAVDSLRVARGDLFQAFQNELCRMKLDISMLDELVHEYCVYRGITDSLTTYSSAPDLVHNSSKDHSPLNIDLGNNKLSDGEVTVYNVEQGGAEEANVGVVCAQGVDMETSSASEIMSNHEDCSTSDANHPQSSRRRLRRSIYHTTGERRCKRWRGRVEKLQPTPVAPLVATNKEGSACGDQDSSGVAHREEKVSQMQTYSENVNAIENHGYDVVLEMKELASKGMAAEVVEEVNAIDRDFFTHNIFLLFQLRQVEFLKLVNGGNLSMALKVACTHLGPLAASNQALLKPLKETLLALLQPSEYAFTKRVPLSVLATSLQVALGKRLGIEEPQLMKIMREVLRTHTEWFKIQMCKDRFEELLKIDQLKEICNPPYTTSKAYSDTSCTNGSSQITSCSSSKLPEDGSSSSATLVSQSNDIGCDENAILKVMEFLALPRADAIHLLMQYDGNAETVIQQIFS